MLPSVPYPTATTPSPQLLGDVGVGSEQLPLANVPAHPHATSIVNEEVLEMRSAQLG